MTTEDPKPARRIPDEGLITIHFKNVGGGKATFDAQVPNLQQSTLELAMRRSANVLCSDITFEMTDISQEGAIFAGMHTIGSFTVTQPTLKGDPDEPT